MYLAYHRIAASPSGELEPGPIIAASTRTSLTRKCGASPGPCEAHIPAWSSTPGYRNVFMPGLAWAHPALSGPHKQPKVSEFSQLGI